MQFLQLSPEDFQCTLDDQSCFKNLKNLQSTNEYLYFPSVESPVQVLQSKSNVEVVTLDNTITESRQHLLASHGKYVSIELYNFKQNVMKMAC